MPVLRGWIVIDTPILDKRKLLSQTVTGCGSALLGILSKLESCTLIRIPEFFFLIVVV